MITAKDNAIDISELGRATKLPRFDIRKKQNLIQFSADVIALNFAYLIQYFIRFESDFVSTSVKPDPGDMIGSGIFLMAYWLLIFFFSGMYKNWLERSPFEETFSILKTTFVGCLILYFFIMYDSGTGQTPRMLIITYFALLTGGLIISRYSARTLEKRLRSRNIIKIPAVIIGSAKNSINFYNRIKATPHLGYDTLGVILTNEDEYKVFEESIDTENIKILGFLDNAGEILDIIRPEEVLITSGKQSHKTMLRIVDKCQELGLRVKIEPDLYDIFTGQARSQMIYGFPLIEISTQLMKPWQEVLKRIFDISFSLLVIVAGMPFWILLAIAIKLDSPGPVFFTQPRVGKNGRIFKIYKFRSMKKNADKQKQKWTSVNDPRVTKFGRFIRKTHLDETPQFLNVLLGDMSVVGPRPEQPQYVQKFSAEVPHYSRRHIVRPGITGWWQVKYSAHVLDTEEIENRLKDDFYYIENMTLQLDFEIVIRTVWCVVSGHGQA